jgi:hypothetical protein
MRLLPRASLKARVNTFGLTLSADSTFLASESTVASEINRVLSRHVRVTELLGADLCIASTRAKEPERLGWLTEEPFADGSLEIAP